MSDPLSAAVAALWERSRPLMLERVETVARGVAALAHGDPCPETRRDAEREAHRLAGALGTFGLPEGSRLARELETGLRAEAAPSPAEAERLACVAEELRRLVEAPQQGSPGG